MMRPEHLRLQPALERRRTRVGAAFQKRTQAALSEAEHPFAGCRAQALASGSQASTAHVPRLAIKPEGIEDIGRAKPQPVEIIHQDADLAAVVLVVAALPWLHRRVQHLVPEQSAAAPQWPQQQQRGADEHQWQALSRRDGQESHKHQHRDAPGDPDRLDGPGIGIKGGNPSGRIIRTIHVADCAPPIPTAALIPTMRRGKDGQA